MRLRKINLLGPLTILMAAQRIIISSHLCMGQTIPQRDFAAAKSYEHDLNHGSSLDGIGPIERTLDYATAVSPHYDSPTASISENGRFFEATINSDQICGGALNIYQKGGGPMQGEWTRIKTFGEEGRGFTCADIEAVSSNDRVYILAVLYQRYIAPLHHHYFLECYWFQISNPNNSGQSSLASSIDQPIISNCSLASDEVNHDGSDVYLYATWLEGNSIKYRRSTNGNQSWEPVLEVDAEAIYMYPGNSIAYIPTTDKIAIYYTRNNFNMRLAIQGYQHSTLYSFYYDGPWYPGYGQENWLSGGIAASQNRVLILFKEGNSGLGSSIGTRTSHDGGFTWNQVEFHLTGTENDHICPSAASNYDECFSALWVVQDLQGNYLGMEARRGHWDEWVNTINWSATNIIDDLHACGNYCSACVENGPWGDYLDYGGAYADGIGYTATSYFGWSSRGDPTPPGPLPAAPNETVSPDACSIGQIHPNPFNPSTSITFTLSEPATIEFGVYNLAGISVGTILRQEYKAGLNVLNFDGSKLSSGIYIYAIRGSNFHRFGKMILAK